MPSKNKLSGVKEFLSGVFAAVIGLITPAILLGLNIISLWLALIIMLIASLISAYFIKAYGVINVSRLSVLIEDQNDLYYLMITPNLRGSMLPKNLLSLLGGPSLTYVINKNAAEVKASQLAQNEEIVASLFKLYKQKGIKTSFDTIMYGKPIYVSKLLDTSFKTTYKKIYRIECLKENGRRSRVKIPHVYPTFFCD